MMVDFKKGPSAVGRVSGRVNRTSRWRLYPRARDAFGAVLDALAIGCRGGAVILPAYVGYSSREGSGVYDPIQERSLSARFYPVCDDLTVDVEHLKSVLEESPQSSALVLIHYFGRPDPELAAIIRLARHLGVPVIEDAAHAYFSAEALASCGKDGEAVLYSMHKMFDVHEGGVLKLNTEALAAVIPPGAAGQVCDADWVRVFEEDVTAHSQARVANYHKLVTRLRALAPAVVPLWPGLPVGTVPQTCPVRVSNTTLRDQLYFGLKAEGFVVASLYHTLIRALEPECFTASHRLSERMLNLPVAPSMTEAEVDRMVEFMSSLITRST
ncbi:MAG: DegT/DnrJ/EryC1/StrS family aminotransferase [Candidatus Omnitrophica bacterium]|nr:DegT/DnrJ/EryC1/StrS family aminotransferase [Candidatus Omnitrophota bacterium]